MFLLLCTYSRGGKVNKCIVNERTASLGVRHVPCTIDIVIINAGALRYAMLIRPKLPETEEILMLAHSQCMWGVCRLINLSDRARQCEREHTQQT